MLWLLLGEKCDVNSRPMCSDIVHFASTVTLFSGSPAEKVLIKHMYHNCVDVTVYITWN